MNRSKLITKLAVLTILGFSILSFIPAVQGTSSVRPIDDWLLNNPVTGNMRDSDNNLIMYLAWHDIDPDDGFILERVLKDGSLIITVHAYVTDVDAKVRYTQEPFPWIFEGTIDYEYRFKFRLYQEIPGNGVYIDPWTDTGIWLNPGERGPGAVLYFWRNVVLHGEILWYDKEIPEGRLVNFGNTVIGAEPISLKFVASGSGTVLYEGFGYTPGPATINVGQLGLAKPQKPPIYTDFGSGQWMSTDLNFWPFEFIKIES